MLNFKFNEEIQARMARGDFKLERVSEMRDGSGQRFSFRADDDSVIAGRVLRPFYVYELGNDNQYHSIDTVPEIKGSILRDCDSCGATSYYNTETHTFRSITIDVPTAEAGVKTLVFSGMRL